MILKQLTDINGVSGDEDRVLQYLKSQIAQYADEITVDPLGNLIVYKKGTNPEFKVMLSAHMDEVGFIITGIEDNGMLKFKTIGGMDDRILPGKRVLVAEAVQGVIGLKPIHLLDKDERSKNVKLKELFIDIGAANGEEAGKLVNKGDYAAFVSEYTEFGDNMVKAKALDDRVGCMALVEALKNTYEFDLYVCFTVQEEIGLRGSRTAAFRVKPDIALVLEGTTCSDVPNVEKYDYSTVIGGGPALTFIDRTSYPDKNLVDFIYRTALKHRIKVQFKQTATGGNDAGQIQRTAAGVKVATISAPCRYIHSPVSVASLNDIKELLKLLGAVLSEMENNKNAVNSILDGGKADV